MKKDEHSYKMHQSIRLKEFPTEHSLSAYKRGYYFEAITVLHGFIESQLKSLFHVYSSKATKSPLSVAWDINEKLSFVAATHVSFVLQLITKNEYDILIGFNVLRNELIHKFYLDPYDDFYYGISKKKFSSCYKQALKLASKIVLRVQNMCD